MPNLPGVGKAPSKPNEASQLSATVDRLHSQALSVSGLVSDITTALFGPEPQSDNAKDAAPVRMGMITGTNDRLNETSRVLQNTNEALIALHQRVVQ